MSSPSVVDFDHGKLRIAEEVTASAPLGVRFFDAVTGNSPSGLVVDAWPRDAARKVVRSARESSEGIYGFVSLPTTRNAEIGAVDDFGSPTTYLVRVRDPRRRYSPLLIEVGAPAAGITPITLFPAPTFEAPTGFALVRVLLRYPNPAHVGPGEMVTTAPWAALALSVAGIDDPIRSYANENGDALLAVPFPTTVAGTPPHLQSVTAELSVSFLPNLDAHPSPDSLTGQVAGLVPNPIASFPTITEIFNQPATTSGGATSVPVTVVLGQTSVVTSTTRNDLLLDAA